MKEPPEKKPILFAVCFLLCLPAFLPAQTAAEMDAVLEAQALSYAQAARFVLASLDGPAGDKGADAAFEAALAKGWLPKKAAASGTVRLGELSFLMVRAFNIRGGFMYALLPGPRYAFRTMVSRSLIQGAADPGMAVSGERFLHILGRVLDTAGGE
ncbi:MAG: hypothetical protein LBI91_05760 [Spirochaetaceae bacterium]|jgi:hypothetical protein|nr:hypothetical protein [Spirochaetaceae bacterium]